MPGARGRDAQEGSVAGGSVVTGQVDWDGHYFFSGVYVALNVLGPRWFMMPCTRQVGSRGPLFCTQVQAGFSHETPGLRL